MEKKSYLKTDVSCSLKVVFTLTNEIFAVAQENTPHHLLVIFMKLISVFLEKLSFIKNIILIIFIHLTTLFIYKVILKHIIKYFV